MTSVGDKRGIVQIVELVTGTKGKTIKVLGR